MSERSGRDRPLYTRSTLYYCTVLYYTIYDYFYSTTTATPALPMRRPTSFHAPRHPARVQVVLKRAEERFAVAMTYFPDPEFLVHCLDERLYALTLRLC